MKYVYRRRKDGIYEVGYTNLDIVETNRTYIEDWADARICETWSEKQAIEITNAMQAQSDTN